MCRSLVRFQDLKTALREAVCSNRDRWVYDRMSPLSLSFPSFLPRLKMLHRRGVVVWILNNPENNKWCWPPQFYEKIYTFQFWQIVNLDTLIQILLGTIFRTKPGQARQWLATQHTNINVSISPCEHTISNIYYVSVVGGNGKIVWFVVDIMK